MDPSYHDALWAIRWSNGGLTVLSAKHPARAGRIAASRKGSTEDGWPTVDVSVLGVEPVDFLELSVAPRRKLNRPQHGCVRIGDREFPWSGRSSGRPSRRGRVDLAVSTPENRIRPVHNRLWAYVWHPSELVLFSAPHFDAARAWARESPYCLGGAVDPDWIEAVARIELHLGPQRNGFAPTCYRVWVEGFKVGWPPTEAQIPDPDGLNPDGRLDVGARLPIPSYSRTRAYAKRGGGVSARSLAPV